jgi:mRNA-degrading endonuclease RelE of RelBE toxin-antitoxin system
MKSQASPRFWQLYRDLPKDVQRLAVKNYRLWQANPNQPSLRCRRLEGRENLVTVRVGDHYRALGLTEPGGVVWIWIGSHAECSRLIRG